MINKQKYHMRVKKYKPILFCLLATLLLGASCRKTKTEIPLTELEKLPPITQTGANTFGCLVNGKAWLPNGRKSDGWLGKPNLEVFMRLDLPYRTFGINAGQYNGINSNISFGTSKLLQIGEYKFDNTIIDKEVFFDFRNRPWGANSVYTEYSIPYDSVAYRKGKFIITKLDNIVSGTFEIELCKINSGDTLKITNGRFDLKL